MAAARAGRSFSTISSMLATPVAHASVMAMGEGRYVNARLLQAAKAHAQALLLVDLEALAKQAGAMVNAVMLGLIAGCGRLPLPAGAFEAAIRADGKAVDANLAGFRKGLAAARPSGAAPPAAVAETRGSEATSFATLEQSIATDWPLAARDMVREGTRRATYKTVTVTLPANARIRVDRRPAQLSDVKPGQRVAVLRAPERAFVRAHDVRAHP